MKSDLYTVLGVNKNSSQEDIKKTYKKLAKQYHPDLNQNDEVAKEKYKEVVSAYEILGDENKRQRYDSPIHEHSLGDIFASYSQNMQRKQYEKSLDVKMKVKLSFEEAFIGCTKKVTVSHKNPCENCNATGWEKVFVCSKCRGSGVQSKSFKTGPNSSMTMNASCDDCNGTGRKFEDKCNKCNNGYVQDSVVDLDVTIPQGIDSGSYLLIEGKGEIGDNHRGDLYLFMEIEDHDFYERNGLDLYCKIPVNYTKLVFGGEIDIPYFSNQITAKIPKGTQSGSKLKLKQQGFSFQGHRGDMIVLIYAPIPENMNDEYINKLKELEEIENKFPSKELLAFKDKFKGNL